MKFKCSLEKIEEIWTIITEIIQIIGVIAQIIGLIISIHICNKQEIILNLLEGNIK